MEAPVYRLEGVVKARQESLEDFVGPLDLILSLLSRNRMEIKDIQISLILEQYLEWMARRTALDLDVASEFVAMAAHLVYIKTRMLLSIDDEEALSEMELLIATLEEHQRGESYAKIKAVVPELQERFLYARDYIVKERERLPTEKTYRYLHAPGDLRKAMVALLTRVDYTLPPPMSDFDQIVARETYPVTDKAAEVIARLISFGVTRFLALFKGSRSRSEIVATFLAVLELCHLRRLRLAGTAEDCTVTCTGETGDELPMPDVLEYD